VPARKTVCMVVSSVELTAQWFLLGHIAAMADLYDVYLVGNCRDTDYLRRQGIPVDVLYVPIVREISLLSDLKALFILVALFRKRKFDVIHSFTPKAGLLTMLAALLARNHVRAHTFTGQVWAARRGPGRFVLKTMDRLLAACATHILVDSHSQMEFLLRERVISKRKTSVLGSGSISGVDTDRFQPRQDVRDRMRAKLEIPMGATVFVYIGRLKRDKGILDLATAFSQLSQSYANAYLIVVGPDEENLRLEIESRCATYAESVRIVSQTSTLEDYMASADVLCLPSYREGFGSVIIEAAACGVPALASRIYGITDAIREGETGIFHRAGDVGDLLSGMQLLARDQAKRIEMGKSARARAEADFCSKNVTAALLEYYRRRLLAL